MIGRPAHLAAIAGSYPSALPGLEFVGAASIAAADSSTLTLSLDGTLTGGTAASPAAGDLVLAVALATSTSGDRALNVTGDGSGTDYTELVELFQSDARQTNLAAYTKVMGATPDTQLVGSSFLTSGNYGAIVAATVWRHVNATALDVAIQTASGGNSHRCNPASITPITAGASVLAIYAAAVTDGKTAEPTVSGWTTRLWQNQSASSCSAKLVIAELPWTSGAVDPPTWTDSDDDDTNSSWAAITLALRPQ